MKIERLRIRNLRNFDDLQTPEFSPAVNAIVGANGAGKTTIRDAIALLVSGTCIGHDTGQGLVDLRGVRGVKTRWEIHAAITDPKAGLHRTDDEGPRAARQAANEQVTGVAGPKARACLDAGELLRLDRKSRQSLLLELIPEASVELPPALAAQIQKALPGPLTKTVDLKGLDALYRRAYDARTEAGRVLKAAGDPTPPEPPLTDMGDPHDELDQVKIELAALRQERDDLLASSNVSELASVRADIGKLPTKMEIARKSTELLQKLADVTEVNGLNEQKRSALAEQMGAAEGARKAAKAALDAMLAEAADTGRCPTCDHKLTKTDKAGIVATLTKRVDAAGRDWNKLNEELKVIPALKSTVTLDRELSELQAQEQRLAGLLEREQTLSTAVPAGTSPATLAALDTRIANGDSVRDQLVSYIAEQTTYLAALKSQEDARARIEDLAALVDVLGPGGELRKALGGASGLAALHDDLNSYLGALGFEADLRPALDGQGDPLIRQDGFALPLSSLSDGERIAVGACFSCVAAKLTGLGVVCVDNWERLDEGLADALLDVLVDSGNQAFLFCVERDPEDTEARAAKINSEADNPLRVFHLRGGVLSAPGL